MPDRYLSPHELHQKAISVLDQIERIAADWRAGRIPAVAEVDVVTRAVADLRRHIEDARLGLPDADAGPTALHHLAAARALVVEAIGLVQELAAGPPERTPERARTRRPAPEVPPNAS